MSSATIKVRTYHPHAVLSWCVTNYYAYDSVGMTLFTVGVESGQSGLSASLR